MIISIQYNKNKIDTHCRWVNVAHVFKFVKETSFRSEISFLKSNQDFLNK